MSNNTTYTDPTICTAIFNKVNDFKIKKGMDVITVIIEIMQVVETFDFLGNTEKHAYTVHVAKLLVEDTAVVVVIDSIIHNICKASKGQLGINVKPKTKLLCFF